VRARACVRESVRVCVASSVRVRRASAGERGSSLGRESAGES